jgi:hypothetical protein
MAGKSLIVRSNSNAFDLIGQGYRLLTTAEERDNWHRDTLGLEENRPAVLKLAREGYGFTIKRMGG